MRIDSSTVGMESAGSYKSTSVSVRRFAITDYSAELTAGSNALYTNIGDGSEGMETTQNGETAENTHEGGTAKLFTLEDWKSRMHASTVRITHRSQVPQTMEDIRQTTLRYIFDLLFSARRERLFGWENSVGRSRTGQGNTLTEEEQMERLFGDSAGGEVQSIANFGVKTLSLVEENIYTETQSAAFSTVGTVKTADGREINFNVNVSMSRSFQQTFQQELNLASFQMCDPLVINLDTDVAALSDQTFYFDIDGDGEKDEVSGLQSGSGYLALDHNGDGEINDGSELFGTASGDGFADLAKYDQDGNGWIDEADEVWDKLQIWCKDENGKDVLYRLADKGVGAICLQRAATDFTQKDVMGKTLGAIRSTGIFLYENGNVGTVQHVDLAKYEKQA